MKTFAVINPHSGGGRTGRTAKSIAQKLAEVSGPLTVAMTAGPMDAATITRHALRDGFGRVIAVGGDGTINEVVNGFFENGSAINPEAELALLTNGTHVRHRADARGIARADRERAYAADRCRALALRLGGRQAG